MKYLTEVRIELKPGVIDAEGETIQKSLKLLGYPVSNVKTVQVYDITIEAETIKDAEKNIDDACKRLLANPVIQNYSIKLRQHSSK